MYILIFTKSVISFDKMSDYIQLQPNYSSDTNCNNKYIHIHIPAKSFDQSLSISSNLALEINDINPFQNDVISPHWIRSRKWWTKIVPNTHIHVCMYIVYDMLIIYHYIHTMECQCIRSFKKIKFMYTCM